MASGLRLLGTVGAVLILVGFGLVGTGYVYESYYSGQANNCELNPPAHGCFTQERASENASFLLESFFGAGLLLGGLGTGCVLIAAILLMGKWPPRSGGAPPPGNFSAPMAPSLAPSGGFPPGAPGTWPPPGPGTPP